MKSKLIEVRDSATKIFAMITKMVPSESYGDYFTGYVRNVEYKILRGSGYPIVDCPLVLFTELETGKSQYDPYKWDDNTKRTAHRYVNKHYDEIPDGWVLDVETINGDKTSMKLPERYSHIDQATRKIVNDEFIEFYLVGCNDYTFNNLIERLNREYKIQIEIVESPEDTPGTISVKVPYDQLSNLGLDIYDLIPKYLVPKF